MRKMIALLLCLGCLGVARAHDFWLQPSRFWIPAAAEVPMAFLVGHGPDRQSWGVSVDRVTMLRSIGPGGGLDRRGALRAGRVRDTNLSFSTPGTHILALASGHAESNLPAARFNDYLEEEGLTPAIKIRARTGTAARAGREIYSRRAKTLVQVGPIGTMPQAHVTKPVGLTLEIVPERNPYAPGPGGHLPVRVVFEGRPLAGALVKLTDLDADERPVASRLTDRAGRASFSVPKQGAWLLNVVWTKPIYGNPKADFETTFSSLTFGYPTRAEVQ